MKINGAFSTELGWGEGLECSGLWARDWIHGGVVNPLDRLRKPFLFVYMWERTGG